MSATRSDPMIYVEHLTFNQRVSGSNPDALTIGIQWFSPLNDLFSRAKNWHGATYGATTYKFRFSRCLARFVPAIGRRRPV